MKKRKKKDIIFGKGGIIIRRGREETYRLRRTHTHSLSLSLEIMMMSVRRELSILGLVAGKYTEFFFRR